MSSAKAMACACGVVLCVFTACNIAFAKDAKDAVNGNSSGNNGITNTSGSEFQWSAGKRLSWGDFQGPVNALNDESAAATHCGIGFIVRPSANGSKPSIVVYNTFYKNKSWVKADAKTPSILRHEQGHFDLCEIYTRKLRARMSNFNFSTPDSRDALMAIYNDLSNEYEARQQEYEDETVHGTNFVQQKKWLDIISSELN